MPLQKENPGAAQTAAGANDLGWINTDEDSATCTAAQRRAAARLAARFGLTISVALVVATLAGLGGRPA